MRRTFARTTARLLMTALAAGAVAAAIGGVSLAQAGSGHGDRTLTLTEVQTGAVFVDISHSQQAAPGDQAIFRSNLKNANGRRVGYSSVVCEIVIAGTLQCNGVYHLPGGTLTGTATVPENETSTAPVRIAITGGSGRYDHAAGQAVSTPKNQTVSQTVIDLD